MPSNAVLSLFFFSWRSTTVSPSRMGEGFALAVLPAYIFIYCFAKASFCRTSGSSSLLRPNWGILPRMSLPPKSWEYGLLPVTVCGVDCYTRRKSGNDIRQLLPSTVVVVINFWRVFTNLSASPSASGRNGVIFQSLNFCVFAYSANSLLWKGGPLYDLHSSGIPNIEKILSSLDCGWNGAYQFYHRVSWIIIHHYQTIFPRGVGTSEIKRNLLPKWRLINYSFVFMLIILTSLVCTNKIQKNFCFKVRLVRMISIKTKE